MANYQSCGMSIAIEHTGPTVAGEHPAVLVLHGSMGAGSYWMGRFAPTFTRIGIATYAPHYFQKTGTFLATSKKIFDGKHFPAWLDAVRDAVSYVAERPNVDPRRIGLLGFSLGGYLAMALATEDPRIRAVVNLSGGLPPTWEERVTRQMPPVLLLHGGKDPVVPVAEANKAEQALKQKGVPCELEVFPGERHWMAGKAHARVLARVEQFLTRNL
jgi:carboxymethylenebutenolidase